RPPTMGADRRALVIGGGLAGTAAAASLAARGWRITLIERHARLASEASGNPQGILYTRLAAAATPLRELVVAGYYHSLRMLPRLALPADAWQQCGLLQLAFNAEEAKRQAKLLEQRFPSEFFHAVDPTQASALSGIALPAGGLYFPLGGWVDPAALCAALADQPSIELLLANEALSLVRRDNEWAVHGATGCIVSAPVVVFAGAHDTKAFDAARHLPLKTIRGQISLVPQTSASTELRTVVCGESYAAPARDGWHTLGATHKFDDPAIDVRTTEHLE